ncbi:MAG: glycosyltransferase family 4 protein [Lacrimispora sp.]|uniref:glycosyltransferase family 4 protein n=1 Tax=Lacrimispora sp. TaxID=2719234 RepID=UPI0039E62F1A
MKILLFGTGEYYKRYKHWFSKEDILALLDNSPSKHNTCMDGLLILSPGEGIKLPFDVIVILSFFVKEMKEQLIELGVQENKVYHFYDMHQLVYKKDVIKPIQYYGDLERGITLKGSSNKKILLLSQDLELGGPSIALFHAAKTLEDQGYHVLYASMMDGPLRNVLLKNNIPVVVDINLQIETMEEAEWTKEFNLIICNTLNFHIFLMERDTAIPVIWWLHDPIFFYAGARKDNMQKINLVNMEVCSVGPFPEIAIREYIPGLQVKRLLYGVPDMCKQNEVPDIGKTEKREKIRFITIGYINSIKGQDVLLKAIKMMPDEMREKSVFYFVGQKDSPLALELEQEIRSMPEIIMTGVVDRDRINELLSSADVLICPSREDAMPTVAAEAMMHGVPCILSDATGTAEYIEDGINGFVFQSENTQMLLEKIIWCIRHYEKIYSMGKRARGTYDKYFSMDVFKKGLIKLVDDCIDIK